MRTSWLVLGAALVGTEDVPNPGDLSIGEAIASQVLPLLLFRLSIGDLAQRLLKHFVAR